ncbi:MAG: hypothetical protein H0X66_12725 [Verrucomicrobia bacterium]|nr:hypothetical protein [Verrucomicrobiota bacterium]
METEAHYDEAFEFESAFPEQAFPEHGDLNEMQEMDLATELLTVSDEAELDQFLGKLFKKVTRGVTNFAKSGLGRTLGGALKGLAKKALPIAGGALGSFIPIPGVGTAVGTALGSAASNLFEAELEGMDPDQREMEIAHRFVKVASAATKKALSMPPTVDPRNAAIAALKAAIRQQKMQLSTAGANGDAHEFSFETSDDADSAPGSGGSGGGRTGRWMRQGNKIILLDL